MNLFDPLKIKVDYVFRKSCNRLAYAESRLLARVPWFSAGLLFAARRP